MRKTYSLCACELRPHGKLGPIDGAERLARVVTHPNHFRKDGRLKPSVFPLGHIRETGLSLIRVDKLERSELVRQAAAIAGAKEGEDLRGLCVSLADDLRRIVDIKENRSLCVREDPVLNHAKLPDNSAHAVALQACIQSGLQDETEALRIQGELMQLFTKPVAIDELSSDLDA